jgi:flagellar basal-body rod modification protein FlgD
MTPEDFIKMLVAQLQNQDPTQPVDNSEILQQVSQIEAITTDQQLNTTLTSVLLGQNVATASALLSKTVTGADASGNAVSGTVSSVSFSGGAATLTVNGQTIALSSVTGVQP